LSLSLSLLFVLLLLLFVLLLRMRVNTARLCASALILLASLLVLLNYDLLLNYSKEPSNATDDIKGDCWFVPPVLPTQPYSLNLTSYEACGDCKFIRVGVRQSGQSDDDDDSSEIDVSDPNNNHLDQVQFVVEILCNSSHARYQYSELNVVCDGCTTA
jgi:hypothetical protein